jgi:AcrR family transcriptional regulator
MSASPTTSQETRESLFLAAEKLFAVQGIDGASLRAITQEAGVNLAAVHYHFGSKEGLVKALLAHRLRPLNDRRLELLSAAEKKAGSGPPDLEEILRAFVAPVLDMVRQEGSEGRDFACLLGRSLGSPDPRLRGIVIEEFREIKERFGEALRRALPDLPFNDLLWRFFFMGGAMAHAAAAGHLIAELSDGVCAGPDEVTTERLVTFLAGGFSAPPTLDEESV